MTGELWLKWLKCFDGQLTRDSVLLCDNCPAHVDASNIKFYHLKIVFPSPRRQNLNHLDSEMNMSCDDYLDIDLLLVELSSNFNQKEDDEDVDIEIPRVSKSEALDGLNKYISYLEHQDGID
ncbi:unnamed protein product [Brachionus calyciflorus]|uniref:Uncharacterized protein n=1 Tax=Brachionus calyciflorus TaxID=104777 RepID=A0A814JHS6_9BILA|nr:unnamed protein product [Brachionus calyciflorus]